MNDSVAKSIRMMNEYGKEKIPFMFIIDFEMKKPTVLKERLIEERGIHFAIETKTDPASTPNMVFKKYPIEYSEYKIAFGYVFQKIATGYSYLTNLTFPTRIETNLSLNELFRCSNARYKLLFKNDFVVFSPECFVKIENGIISSYPMKGTIDASIPNAREIILNDEKEIAEHTTIVDLIRNDLGIVSKNVCVEKFRYIDHIQTNEKNLLQISSQITGKLATDYTEHLGDIIFSMLPAGSISGAPKKKTVEIIRKAEKIKRGYYTGVFGYFNGKKLDSAVMIRFIENTSKGMFYRSGGGITFMSNPGTEYQELIDKVYVPVDRSD
jgi:para-aminobenzoate synthetase component I